MEGEGRKRFFFEKKKQKTSVGFAAAGVPREPKNSEVLFAFFSFLPSDRRSDLIALFATLMLAGIVFHLPPPAPAKLPVAASTIAISVIAPPTPAPPVLAPPAPLPAKPVPLPSPPKPRPVVRQRAQPRPQPVNVPEPVPLPASSPGQGFGAAPAAPLHPGPPPASFAAVVDDAYLAALKTEVAANTHYPDSYQALTMRPQGFSEVTFTLDRGGAVLESHISAASGSALLDRTALAIVAGSHFPAMPASSFPGETQHQFAITITFTPPPEE